MTSQFYEIVYFAESSHLKIAQMFACYCSAAVYTTLMRVNRQNDIYSGGSGSDLNVRATSWFVDCVA